MMGPISKLVINQALIQTIATDLFNAALVRETTPVDNTEARHMATRCLELAAIFVEVADARFSKENNAHIDAMEQMDLLSEVKS